MTAVAESPRDTGTSNYAEAFAELQARAGQDALHAIRTAAFARFQQQGFPTTREEAFRNTNLAQVARIAFGAAPPASAGAPLAVFVNGRRAASEPATGGIRVLRLHEALALHSAQVLPHLDVTTTALLALNTAFLEEAAVVVIPDGHVASEPLRVDFVTTEGGEPWAAHPRVLVLAGRGSQATLLETYSGSGVHLTNALTQLVLAEGAIFHHERVQQESTAAYHLATTRVRQGRDSRYSSVAVNLGAALMRHDLDQAFVGEGGECDLLGLYLAGGTQHTDTHTRVDHAQPHCTSRQVYKGILDGRSRGVFHGTVMVRPDAQKTDARQTNKNLLLSREALVDSTPVLEIFADDVKCKHGSTIGALDPQALFYLRSRGIDERAARGLLTWAFASDIVEKLGNPELREQVAAAVKDTLQEVI